MSKRIEITMTVLAPDDADPDSVAGYAFDRIAGDKGGDEYITEAEGYDFRVVE